MFKRTVNDKKVSLCKTFRRKIFKERLDRDIAELIDLLAISHKKMFKGMTLKQVRSSHIKSNFDTVEDLIDSAYYLITCMKELKNVNISTLPNLEEREVELEKWMGKFLLSDSGLEDINFQMSDTTKVIKDELENLLLKNEANKHSYYKRLSKIYFQEIKTWLDLLDELTQTKQS